MIEISGYGIDRAILKLRENFDPIRREIRDREYFMSRTQRRKRKDIRARFRIKKKEQRLKERRRQR